MEEAIGECTKIVALDQHMDSITVALTIAGNRSPELYGDIPPTSEAVNKLVRRLDDGSTRLRFCYEAGPCGYGLYRHHLQQWMSGRMIRYAQLHAGNLEDETDPFDGERFWTFAGRRDPSYQWFGPPGSYLRLFRQGRLNIRRMRCVPTVGDLGA